MSETPEHLDLPHEDEGEASAAADERVAELLSHTIDVPVLAEAVERQQAADAADTLETLEDEEAVELLEQMQEQAAAEALAEMEAPLAVTALVDLIADDADRAGRLLGLMAPDDAADLLQALDEPIREQVFTIMPPATAVRLRQLSRYEPESAGGLMTTDFVAVHEARTVAETIELLRTVPLPDYLNHLLVVDANQRLIGVVGLRRLLLNSPDTIIADIMKTEVRTVGPDVDRETVAQQFDRYDYYMLAVVDDAGRLLGLVTVDDVIDIIRDEQTEDVQKSVGAGAGEAVYSPLGEKIRGRFPWLGMSLGLMCGSASVVLFFEELITERPVLAFLMPVIAAVVGNGGQQALMVTLRGIVLEEVRPDRVGPLLVREVAVGLFNGIVLGIALFLVIGLLSEVGTVSSANWTVGAVAGIAMLMSMSAATLVGTGIPLLMRRIGVDPALAASIILIMVTDFLAFTSIMALSAAAL